MYDYSESDYLYIVTINNITIRSLAQPMQVWTLKALMTGGASTNQPDNIHKSQ